VVNWLIGKWLIGELTAHYSPLTTHHILFYLENRSDFVGKLSDVKRLSYEIFSAGF
jgi:hypothetical protein